MAICAAGLVAGFVVLRGAWARTATIYDCMKGTSCAGLNVRSGSRKLSAEQTLAIMKARPLAEGAKWLTRVEIVRYPQGGPQVLAVTPLQGDERASVMELHEWPGGDTLLLGDMVRALLTVSAFHSTPELRTRGQLYSMLAAGIDQILPALQAQGITRFDLNSSEDVPVEEAAEDWRKMAIYNRDRVVPVLHP